MKRDVFSESANETFSYEALGNGMVRIWLADKMISKAERLINAQANYAVHGIPADDLWADDAAINQPDGQ